MAATDTFLNVALARDPSRPLLTFYDDATGERTELSAATLDNWVAKTANLLADEVGLVAGERVAVLLPVHWQTAAVLLAAWTAGGLATVDPAGARVAFAAASQLDEAAAAEEVYALSLAPLGRGFDGGPPAGTLDYADEVRGHGDVFSPAGRVADDAPALAAEAGVLTGAELVERTRRRAAELGLTPKDRVLTARGWTGPADWVEGLLVPLAGGASLVMSASPDPAALPGRARDEHATATVGVRELGVELAGVRAL